MPLIEFASTLFYRLNHNKLGNNRLQIQLCKSLTSVNIPESVTTIGEGAFSSSGLTSVNIPESVTTIGKGAFYACYYLLDFTIPSSITSLEEGILGSCSRITSIVIPENITSIGSRVFEGMTRLTSVIISSNVTSIGDQAFKGCSELSTITIPSSVTEIGKDAFYGCTNLTKVIVPNLSAWCNIHFGNNRSCPMFLSKHIYSDEYTEIKDLIIPEGVTSINSFAFDGCAELVNVSFPSSLTSIEYSSFGNCNGLTSVIIPEGVVSLGGFQYCKNLVSVSIPSTLTTIKPYAFDNCQKLSSITIPKDVTSIGKYAFNRCSNLSSVTSYIEEPFAFGNSAFWYISSSCVLYVPAGTRDAYIAAGWTEEVFKGGVIEMPDPSVNEDTDISEMANVIYAENISVRKGDSTTLEIKMNNELIPTGCTFSITLPEGLSLVTDADGDVVCSTTDRSRKMSVIQAQGGTGIYNFALTPSNENATISGTSGAIMTLKLRADENMETGDYKVSMKKNSISYKSGGMTADEQLSDIIRTITVEDYLMGDVNSDGQISLADAVMILYHYFGVSQTGFKEKAADVTDDGNISLADAIEVLYKYFGMDVNWVKERPSQMIDPD